MILDKRKSCLWKLKYLFCTYSLVNLLVPMGPNRISWAQSPKSMLFFYKFDQGSDKPGKPWKPWKKGFIWTQRKLGKLREKNWKKWNLGKTHITFLYDGKKIFLKLFNWLEINCRILNSYYFSFSETTLDIMIYINMLLKVTSLKKYIAVCTLLMALYLNNIYADCI